MTRIVPPLIDADRKRRWDEIRSRPATSEDDVNTVYEREAGPDEGHGHARFDHAIHVAAIVTAWELFRDCLTRMLREAALRVDLSGHPLVAKLVDDEVKQWDRRFDRVETRLKDFTGTDFRRTTEWRGVQHAQQLRNALTHNLGLYTNSYLSAPGSVRPTREDLFGARPPVDDKDLVDETVIPLSPDLVATIVDQLLVAAYLVRDKLSECRTLSR
jgi:hypothetical protein